MLLRYACWPPSVLWSARPLHSCTCSVPFSNALRRSVWVPLPLCESGRTRCHSLCSWFWLCYLPHLLRMYVCSSLPFSGCSRTFGIHTSSSVSPRGAGVRLCTVSVLWGAAQELTIASVSVSLLMRCGGTRQMQHAHRSTQSPQCNDGNAHTAGHTPQTTYRTRRMANGASNAP